MWMERADYGHFFYRIANGESAADAYDRVSGFNESLWRLFGEQDFASVCVLVTHGLMARVFMMKWYHWSVEYFEDLRNINHCEFVIMTHDPGSGKYALQNKLRTWSDLRQERERERVTKEVVSSPITLTDPTPIRRKWGGCPDGCNHMPADVQRSLRAKLVGSVRHESGHPRHKHVDGHVQSTYHSKSHNHHETAPADRTSAALTSSESASKPSNPVGDVPPNWNDLPSENPHADRHANRNPRLTVEAGDAQNDSRLRDSSSDSRPNAAALHPKRPTLNGLHRDSEDHLLHPPASSSSTTCLKLALLHLGGRDGGGSLSGANSLAPSDDEGDDHDHHAPVSRVFGRGISSTPTAPTGLPLQSPSQEFENDGDDEMSGNLSDRYHKIRTHHHHDQNHNHHHHHHHHQRYPSSNLSQGEHRMANILGDGDSASTQSEIHSQT
jgi:hypothetical protein